MVDLVITCHGRRGDYQPLLGQKSVLSFLDVNVSPIFVRMLREWTLHEGISKS